MIRVYHQRNFDNNTHYYLAGQLKLDNLQLVAEVDTEDLQEAFELTNTIETPWVKNPKVRALVAEPRSTSMGDVMISSDNKIFAIAMCGFEPLMPNERTLSRELESDRHCGEDMTQEAQIAAIDKAKADLLKVKQIIQEQQWNDAVDEIIHYAQGHLLITYGAMSQYRANQYVNAKKTVSRRLKRDRHANTRPPE